VAGAVFAVFFLFLFFQDAKGFARKIMTNFFMDDTKYYDAPTRLSG
jgi:hypothetical protein